MSSRARNTNLRTSTPGHRLWFAAGCIAIALSTPAAGQDDELVRLHQEAAALRQALERLEARIQALEGNAGAASASPGYSNGKPEKVLRIDNTPVWYYIYPEIGRGSVFFNGNGKVSSAQSPSLGW